MADSPTMLLMISAVSSAAGNEYIGVDNVSVTEGITVLPEPATYATLLAGLVAVSFAARHRKNELRHRPTCLR